MMRINAYIMAADPAWIEQSVLSYYNIVEKIVVSYDRDGKGFTGVDIASRECVDRVLAIDTAHKVKLLEGSFYRPGYAPMENDTYQRQCAVDEAGKDADWVLELDTDEVLPDAGYFMKKLREIPPQYTTCMWPMRVIFKQINTNTFLEVSTRYRMQYSEYPGPVACRPGVILSEARRTQSAAWTYGIESGIRNWFGVINSRRNVSIDPSKAIFHFSWARTDEEMQRKLASWGHSGDFDLEGYLSKIWLPAESQWRKLRNFHPIWPELWPALRKIDLQSQLYLK